MEIRISDFALPCRAIQVLCHKFQQTYCDVPIVFADGPVRHENGVFYLSNNGTIGKTMFSIFYLYLRYYLDSIPDDSKADAAQFFLALIRDFQNQEDTFSSVPQEDVLTMRLNQFPFVWLLLKNIVCPVKGLQIQNTRVIAGRSAKVDAACYLTQTDLRDSSLPSEAFPFIFVNLDVGSEAVRSAHLLVEGIRAMTDGQGLGEPEDILRGIFSDFLLKDKLVLFAKTVFTDDKDERAFFASLAILCRSEEMESVAMGESRQSSLKEAQSSGNGPWWFMGLTEKMLEPARSSDWTVTEMWKPVTEELWTKVETERRKRGLDEVPFELLLRIQSKDFKTDSSKTLQELLSDDRVW